ncbi:MAG: type II secretion system protein GspC, partial [Gammaproteobacteria bacterium]|nr:type II secretion system protein GspC [Gammaproteobacteria bacterium]
WQLFTDEQDTQTTTIKNQVKSVELIDTAVSVPDLNDVAAYHLFGDAKKPVVVQQQVIDAPETRLKLELKGVFATTNASEALAIISSSKDKDKTYHIGDKVIGGALLHAVYADRIIIKRNGRLETLRLPKPKVDSKAFYSSEPATESNEQSVKRTSQNNVSVQEQLPGMQVNQSQNQRLKNMRDTLINEPEKIWEQVRINPVMNDGKVQGYTLSHDDQDLMTAMNIRNTDVITGINGHSLSDPATLYGLINTLSEQQSLELTVQRNGQEQTIQLSF